MDDIVYGLICIEIPEAISFFDLEGAMQAGLWLDKSRICCSPHAVVSWWWSNPENITAVRL